MPAEPLRALIIGDHRLNTDVLRRPLASTDCWATRSTRRRSRPSFNAF
ncbi:MAG: hypothetical protein IPK19_27475 [Chloroflexi bacterium]|nr:hypothetical protein [Chloroflexota bacterium]